MKHYVFIRPDPKFNESQWKDSYYLLSLVSSNRMTMELVLSLFFSFLNPINFSVKSLGILVTMASDFCLQSVMGLAGGVSCFWGTSCSREGMNHPGKCIHIENVSLQSITFSFFFTTKKETWVQMDSSDLNDLFTMFYKSTENEHHSLVPGLSKSQPYSSFDPFKRTVFSPTPLQLSLFLF